MGTGSGFLSLFEEDGNRVFTNKLTDGEFILSGVSGMAVEHDGAGVYMVGGIVNQEEAFEPLPPEFFLKKFDYDGNELDSIDLSVSSEGIATDSSQAYVVGLTTGDPSTQLDVYLRIYAIS